MVSDRRGTRREAIRGSDIPLWSCGDGAVPRASTATLSRGSVRGGGPGKSMSRTPGSLRWVALLHPAHPLPTATQEVSASTGVSLPRIRLGSCRAREGEPGSLERANHLRADTSSPSTSPRPPANSSTLSAPVSYSPRSRGSHLLNPFAHGSGALN